MIESRTVRDKMAGMPRAATKENHHHVSEISGLILLGIGTLLFLALISYRAAQVPDWFPLSSVSSEGHVSPNFIGPFGAILSCCFYFFFGATSFLIAALLFGFGGAKLLRSDFQISSRLIWSAVFVASGASLAHLQPWFLHDWHGQMNILGPGGILGFAGAWIFKKLFGTIGSAILLITIYCCSIIFVTGIRPVYLLRAIVQFIPKTFARYRVWREVRATEREQLDAEQKRLEHETRKLEKRLPKKAAQNKTETENSANDEASSISRPAPQIIDTALMPISRKPKPAPADSADVLAARDPQDFENYTLPSIDLLNEIDLASRQAADPEELQEIQETIIETLTQFGISVSAGNITKGPTITRYEVYPAKGVSVNKIVNLERDIARATRAERINILAPIPGKDTVGIEIANSKKVKIAVRELFESEDWENTKARIPLAIGKDVYGRTIIADLASMPHCLVAGATGSGKSVCINSIIASIVYKFTPKQLRFIMIDPKVVEMQVYNKLPHLAVPVVTDPKKVLLALRWVIDEMEKRYKIFAKTGVRNITSFNERPKPKSQAELDEETEKANAEKVANGEPIEEKEDAPESGSTEEYLANLEKIRVPRADDIIVPEGELPYIVVIIDELADLMQTAPADVESAIARITQMARAAGIHMIVATQTPRADIVTGVIKANIPSRMAFQVSSKIDSRVILDENGAERLLGQGDMLYLPPGTSKMLRAQGAFVTDDEINRLVDFCAAQSDPAFEPVIQERLEKADDPEFDVSDEDEELVQKCIDIMRQEKKASTSMFQRRLRLGYTRAARVVDILEQRGYVAPGEGAKPREILVDLDTIDASQ